MDGSAYRRLDRVSAVVVDGATLCTGPPVVVEVGLEPAAEAGGWDAVALWTGVSRLLGPETQVDGRDARRACGWGSAGADSGPPRRPGARVRCATPTASGSAPSSSPTSSTRTPRPCCGPSARPGTGSCSPRTPGPPTSRALADEVAEPRRDACWRPSAGCRPRATGCSSSRPARAAWTCRARRRGSRGARTPGPRCSPRTSPSPRSFPGRAPAWGADLVTGAGLADACRIVAATAAARSAQPPVRGDGADRQRPRRPARRRRQRASAASAGRRSPGKSATALTTWRWGAWTALRSTPGPSPSPRCTRPGTRWTRTRCCAALADPRARTLPRRPPARSPGLRRGGRRGRSRTRASPARCATPARSVAELADPSPRCSAPVRRPPPCSARPTDARPRRRRHGGQRADQWVPAAARRDGARVAAARAGGRRAPRDPRRRRRRRPRGRARGRAAGRRRDLRRVRRRRPRRRTAAGVPRPGGRRVGADRRVAGRREGRRRRRPAPCWPTGPACCTRARPIVAGHGRAVVVAVGAATAAGRATAAAGVGRAPGRGAGPAGRADPLGAAADAGRRRSGRRAVAAVAAPAQGGGQGRGVRSPSPRCPRGCRWSRPSRSRPPRAGCRAAAPSCAARGCWRRWAGSTPSASTRPAR